MGGGRYEGVWWGFAANEKELEPGLLIDAARREQFETLMAEYAKDGKWWLRSPELTPIVFDTLEPDLLRHSTPAGRSPLPVDGTLFEIEIGEAAGEGVEMSLVAFDTDGVSTSITGSVRPIEKPKELKSIMKLEGCRRVTASDLRQFDARCKGDELAFHHVGQGNMASLWHQGVCTGIFFDYGWASRQNAHTAPAHVPPELALAELIVLSHWDEDHYAAAKLPQAAPRAIWFAPPLITTADALRVAGTLNLAGQLRVYGTQPASLRPRNPTVQIVKCDGRAKNESGLVCFVGGQALLPGDAKYSTIARADPAILAKTSILCASHHGSRHATAGVPRHWKGTLIFSYGEGNHHGHPHHEAEWVYADAGWQEPIRLPKHHPIVKIPLISPVP